MKWLLFFVAACAAIQPRQAAPPFTANAVVNEKFATVKLSDYKDKWVVLLFYPFDFTFVCPTEILAYSKATEEFAAIGASIVGISTDSHHTHLAWIRTPRASGGLGGELHFPLVADISKQISVDYGLLVTNPEDSMYGTALRGIVIIDDKGIVRSVNVNDFPVGRNVEETLRLIKAFQYHEKHGEVCPANWKPGDRTMIPDPDASKAYFEAVNKK